MDQTPRLSLPFIAPSQAQKHVTHNESLRLLDALVQLVVVSTTANTPPVAPASGAVWALGAAPTGVWVAQAGNLAIWSENAWQFVTPQTGWQAWDLASGRQHYWTGLSWTPVPLDLENLPSLGINTTADTSNRLALASAASLFSHDGAGHQIKVNKATASDTASLLYQTGFSGRAEMGLSGDDSFSIKVSADGGTWRSGMVINKSTGNAGFGTTSPARAVHISSVLRIQPSAAPSSPAAGDIYYDSTTNKLRCHNGTIWADLF